MRIKNMLFLTAVLLSGLKGNAFDRLINPTDTVPVAEVKTRINIVKIGPEEYYLPPPVDSVLLRKLAKLASEKAFNEAIDGGFREKEKQDISLKNQQNILLLQQILDKTETSAEPTENIIATLAPALQAYKKSGDIKGQSLIMNTYAVYYVKTGDVDKAIPYFQEALRLKEQTKDKNAVSKITVNLAAIFKILGKYDESIAYNEYTIRNSSTDFKDRSKKAEAYINIALVKSLQQKYAEAETYILKKGLPLFQSAGNKKGRMSCFTNLADIYKVQKRYSEAKWFYLQADLMAHILNDTKAQVFCLISLAEVKNAIGDHDLALEDYKRAELLASENNYNDTLAEIKGEIGETYWKMGNYTAAGNALKEYTRLKDILAGVAQ